MTQTKQTSTLRINTTRARIIKLAIENYEEIAKLNFTTNDYAELLKIKSLCEKQISQTQHIQQTKQNDTHITDTDSKKVSE
jgi:hypothetical protein